MGVSLHPGRQFLKGLLNLWVKEVQSVGTLVFAVAAIGGSALARLVVGEILHPE